MKAIVKCILNAAVLPESKVHRNASKIAHYAMDNDLTLKAAALKLGFATKAEFDHAVDPKKMVRPYIGTASAAAT